MKKFFCVVSSDDVLIRVTNDYAKALSSSSFLRNSRMYEVPERSAERAARHAATKWGLILAEGCVDVI